MEIKKIRTIRVAAQNRALWVQLETDEGHVGLGETWYGAEAVEGSRVGSVADAGALGIGLAEELLSSGGNQILDGLGKAGSDA